MPDDPPAALAAVLQAIDTVLAQRPRRSGPDFAEATRRLASYRDSLAAKGDRVRLEIANMALSVVVGGHFPLGEVPWSQIEAARNQLGQT
jgi:hypothetical protein